MLFNKKLKEEIIVKYYSSKGNNSETLFSNLKRIVKYSKEKNKKSFYQEKSEELLTIKEVKFLLIKVKCSQKI